MHSVLVFLFVCFGFFCILVGFFVVVVGCFFFSVTEDYDYGIESALVDIFPCLYLWLSVMIL